MTIGSAQMTGTVKCPNKQNNKDQDGQIARPRHSENLASPPYRTRAAGTGVAKRCGSVVGQCANFGSGEVLYDQHQQITSLHKPSVCMCQDKSVMLENNVLRATLRL